MQPTTTHEHDSKREAVLYMAMELSQRNWKLAFTPGRGYRPRERNIPARDCDGLEREIAAARAKFGLAATCPVVSCYEAGRDGLWVHRALEAAGVRNVVVDPASIEVDRRARRAKTDRLDAHKLVEMLVRWAQGERRVWRTLRVPNAEQEDARHLHRGLEALKQERTRLGNRIKGLLATQGIVCSTLGPGFAARLPQLRQWDGAPLGPGLQLRLAHEHHRLQLVGAQLRELERQRLRGLAHGTDTAACQARKLMTLKSIGPGSAWLFTTEAFAWRELRNRRQVGALPGLTPTPYASGPSHREQGISKAGSRRLRKMAVEIAWLWLRHQPHSELSRWYRRRFGGGSSRLRRIGIVALARKLFIALWRFVHHDVLPAGAVLKG